jgi:hypothetical protein
MKCVTAGTIETDGEIETPMYNLQLTCLAKIQCSYHYPKSLLYKFDPIE